LKEVWGVTTKERRTWKAEEKLVIIKEEKECGNFDETCGKYPRDSDMYFKLKESNNSLGLDSLTSNYKSIELGMRKSKNESDKLKELLIEKELENALRNDALRKR
jgi:hypothetical protein